VHFLGLSVKPEFVDGKPAGSGVVLSKESVYINLCMVGLKEHFFSCRPSGKVLLDKRLVVMNFRCWTLL
jgi:hypothetical protein